MISGSLEISVKDEALFLLKEKALYWPKRQALIIADLHLGKASHFRRYGVPVPLGVVDEDLRRLSYLIDTLTPKEVIFLGDLFHSTHNVEWELFSEWKEQYKQAAFVLVIGNHDILDRSLYSKTDLEVLDTSYDLGPFSLSHQPASSRLYTIAGHIHPAIQLRGQAHEKLTLPCFLFKNSQAVLPAFGGFTGTFTVVPEASDKIYAVTDSAVLDIT